MDRQTLRDWVRRYNADGVGGLELCGNLGDGMIRRRSVLAPRDLDAVGERDTLDDPRIKSGGRLLGNWFSPFSRRQVMAAAMTSLNTISRAVSCDSAPLVRTVRCLTVANTLSIGLDVRRCSQCSAGKS